MSLEKETYILEEKIHKERQNNPKHRPCSVRSGAHNTVRLNIPINAQVKLQCGQSITESIALSNPMLVVRSNKKRQF